MRIIQYDPKYKEDFIKFNTDWIIDYFGFLEEGDLKTFDHVEEDLQKGAMVFFAIDDDGTALATCMTKPMQRQGA